MTAATSAPIISAKAVTRAFDDRVVVDDLSFDVHQGTILGVVGPSGSGKTTTVRMLTGTLGRTSGEMHVLGEDPMRFSKRVRGRIAYMPQLFSLYEDLSAQENVGFVAALYGIGPFKRRKLIRRALELVELTDARHRLARDLSGGMQRRLELACALVHSPEVLFVDEPTAGIDPILRQAIWQELRKLRDERAHASGDHPIRVGGGSIAIASRSSPTVSWWRWASLTRCARWSSAAMSSRWRRPAPWIPSC